jgi:hypothetical protein
MSDSCGPKKDEDCDQFSRLGHKELFDLCRVPAIVKVGKSKKYCSGLDM